jgi:hypothetical protein
MSARQVQPVPVIITAIVIYYHHENERLIKTRLKMSVKGTESTWKKRPKSGDITAMLIVNAYTSINYRPAGRAKFPKVSELYLV